MPVPSSLADISTTAASNYPAGADAVGTSLDDYLRTIQAIIKRENSKGSDITASTTIDVPADGSYFVVTGNTTIAGISDDWNGRLVVLKFSGTPQLTHSSGFILPSSANITVAAGDCIAAVNESTGVWRVVWYQKATGSALVPSLQRFTVGGTADAMTGTLSPAIASYAAGLRVTTTPGGANTVTGPTLNLNSLGTKTIKKRDSGGTKVALVAGDYNASGPFDLEYDGTDFILLNPVASSSSSGGGFKNALINGAFSINQRATASNADDTYAHDRWNVLTQTGTIAVSTLADVENTTPFMARLTQSQASAQRMGYSQIIEGKNCKHFRGQQVTFRFGRERLSDSANIRIAVLEWTGTEDVVTSDVVNDWTSSTYTAGNFFLAANLTVSGVVQQALTANTLTDGSAVTVTLGSSFNNLIVFAWTEGAVSQNVTLDLGKAQIEAGASATAFETRSVGQELELCQRYAVCLTSANGSFAVGVTTAVSSGVVLTQFPATMRSAPSLSINTVSVNLTIGTVSGAASAFSLSSSSLSGALFSFSIGSSPGGGVGSLASIASGMLALTSEL